MEERTVKTRELERSGRPADYRLWFRLADGSRLTVEMSLSGLLALRGFVDRAISVFEGMDPTEINGARAEAPIAEAAKAEAV